MLQKQGSPIFENSVNIADELAHVPMGAHYQSMGGIPTRAISSPNAIFLPSDETIVVPDYVYLSNWRTRQCSDATIIEKPTSLRDADYLLMTTDQPAIDAAQAAAEAVAAGRMEISVFGLHPYKQLEDQRNDPLGSVVRVWLSDRYVTNTTESGQLSEASVVYKSLFPFAAPVAKELGRTWTLRLEGNNGLELPIAHPAAMLLNYFTRSISGLRPKDAEKINVVAANIFRLYPDVLQILKDGEGRNQVDLAGAFYTLSGGERTTLLVGDQETHNTLMIRGADNVQRLRDRTEFMLHDASAPMQAAVLRVSALKSRMLHAAEGSNLVNWWQAAGMEQVVRAIITNKQ